MQAALAAMVGIRYRPVQISQKRVKVGDFETKSAQAQQSAAWPSLEETNHHLPHDLIKVWSPLKLCPSIFTVAFHDSVFIG